MLNRINNNTGMKYYRVEYSVFRLSLDLKIMQEFLILKKEILIFKKEVLIFEKKETALRADIMITKNPYFIMYIIFIFYCL